MGSSAQTDWGIAVPRPAEPQHGATRLTPCGTLAGIHSTLPPMLSLILPIAAAGWSMLYLLFGGGLVGAVVIFIVAKLFGK
jgi:hypothetical protein